MQKIYNYPLKSGERRIYVRVPVLITKKKIDEFIRRTGIEPSYANQYGSYVMGQIVWSQDRQKYFVNLLASGRTYPTEQICGGHCALHNLKAGYNHLYVHKLKEHISNE